MQIRLMILLIMFILSCNTNKVASTGSNNQITIVVSNEDKDIINLYLTPLFNKKIMTPIEENLYDIDIISPELFNSKKYHKNIIITSISDPPDSTGDLLYSKFNQLYKKKVFSLDDLYSNNQVIICINSDDLNDFINTIDSFNGWILNTLDDNIFNNYYNHIISSEKNENIINILKKKYQIDVKIDNNYKVIKDEDELFWIGRGHPYRWIVFNRGSLGNKNHYISSIVKMLENDLTNVQIPEKYLKIEKLNNNLIVRGLYEQLDSDTGGPFFTYIFEDYNNNEVIFVSGFVNNPGKKKASLLLQLETIIKSIRFNYE